MKKIFRIILLVAFLLSFITSFAFAQGIKTPVCHLDADSGTYSLIHVNENAYDAHVDHGDASPGDAVPGMDGYEFGEDCTPVRVSFAKAGCFQVISGSYYVLTDGTNPQLTPLPIPLYPDSNCTTSLGELRGLIALVWAGNTADALAICQSVGGNSVVGQPEPHLYYCI